MIILVKRAGFYFIAEFSKTALLFIICRLKRIFLVVTWWNSATSKMLQVLDKCLKFKHAHQGTLSYAHSSGLPVPSRCHVSFFLTRLNIRLIKIAISPAPPIKLTNILNVKIIYEAIWLSLFHKLWGPYFMNEKIKIPTINKPDISRIKCLLYLPEIQKSTAVNTKPNETIVTIF